MSGHDFRPVRRVILLLGATLSLVVGATGCDALEELREQITNSGGSKPTPPEPGKPAPTDPGRPTPPEAGKPVPPTPAPKPCASSAECAPSDFCTTEKGACDRPPGCGPNVACPAVCYGTCQPRVDKGTPCGPKVCTGGLECCNESCGICTKPGEGCTKQLCPQPPKPVACASDADCRLFSDYCTGCDCRALSRGEPDPTCKGPGVQCFVDPCRDKKAACIGGKCAVVGGTPVPPPPTRCEKRQLGSDSSCKTPDIWKQHAHDDCRASGLNLTEIYPSGDCGGGATRFVFYVCCAP